MSKTTWNNLKYSKLDYFFLEISVSDYSEVFALYWCHLQKYSTRYVVEATPFSEGYTEI